MTSFQSSQHNPWNPFASTKRDIQRTNVLAKKKVTIVLLLGLLLSPLASALYLNRGLNAFKLLGYVFFASLIVAFQISDDDAAAKASRGIGVLGGLVMTAEQSLSVKNARLRKK